MSVRELAEGRRWDTGITGEPVVAFSDLHMGDGSKADDFLENESVFLQVLDWAKPFQKVYCGDVAELWQAKRKSIRAAHKNTLIRMRDDGGVYIFGNHDFSLSAWDGVFTYERHIVGKTLFIHGYQPDRWNGKYRWAGRIATWVGGMFERMGWQDIDESKRLSELCTPTQMSDTEFHKVEDLYLDWAYEQAKEAGCTVVVFGHTHRPGMKVADDVLVVNAGDWVSDEPTFVLVRRDCVELYKVAGG